MEKEKQALTFKHGETEIKVPIQDNTAWLSIKQMAELYDVTERTIKRHISTTYNEGFFKRENSCHTWDKVCHTNGQNITSKENSRTTKYYNLDIVLEVGKRLKSNNGVSLKNFIENSKTQTQSIEGDETIVYNNGALSLDVKVSPDRENVWLSQGQIATLFDTTQPNISMHINNILSDGELDDSVHKDFLYTGSDGKKYSVTFYNLDLILAVGYRVKGERAIQFRKWASSVLKQYLIKGYALNGDRLSITNESILRLRNEMDAVYEKIESINKVVFPKSPVIFESGQYFDAYEYLRNLIKMANESIIIVDPFFDNDAIKYLKHTKTGVERKVYISHINLLDKAVIKSFRKQYGPITFYAIRKMHDRFIIIDSTYCYSIGTSLNNVGARDFAILRIEDQDIINLLVSKSDNCPTVF